VKPLFIYHSSEELWLSWQCPCLQFQRSQVRIPASNTHVLLELRHFLNFWLIVDYYGKQIVYVSSKMNRSWQVYLLDQIVDTQCLTINNHKLKSWTRILDNTSSLTVLTAICHLTGCNTFTEYYWMEISYMQVGPLSIPFHIRNCCTSLLLYSFYNYSM
jgi:hypothetical protein